MIDVTLYHRYVETFGPTFSVDLWDRRPGDTLNRMMRAALRGEGPVVTDDQIAGELATRVGLPPEPL